MHEGTPTAILPWAPRAGSRRRRSRTCGGSGRTRSVATGSPSAWQARSPTASLSASPVTSRSCPRARRGVPTSPRWKRLASAPPPRRQTNGELDGHLDRRARRLHAPPPVSPRWSSSGAWAFTVNRWDGSSTSSASDALNAETTLTASTERRDGNGVRFALPNTARRQQMISIRLRPVRPRNAAFAHSRGRSTSTVKALAHGIPQAELDRFRAFMTRYTSLEELTESRRLGHAIDDGTYDARAPYLGGACATPGRPRRGVAEGGHRSSPVRPRALDRHRDARRRGARGRAHRRGADACVLRYAEAGRADAGGQADRGELHRAHEGERTDREVYRSLQVSRPRDRPRAVPAEPAWSRRCSRLGRPCEFEPDAS